MTTKKLIVLRQNKPNIGKVIGDVIDSLEITTFNGIEVNKIGENFVCIVVVDLDEDLEEELLSGVKRLRSPDLTDPFYQELLSTGTITTDNETLINYIEAI